MIPADSSPPCADDTEARHPARETDRALRWVQRAGAEQELLGEIAMQVGRRRRRRMAAWATVSLVLVVGGVVWRDDGMRRAGTSPVGASDARRTATATVSGPRREALPDGSTIELKEGAAISHDFSGAFRRVTLERGEVHFQVVKDALRPFIVTAGGVAIRAVGTAFTVQLDAAAVEVVVTEGRVVVDKPGEASAAVGEATSPVVSAGPAAVLDAGGRAIMRAQEAAPEVSVFAEDELAKRLAWRVPQLEFSRTPLAEAVALMNEHGGGVNRVVIEPGSKELAEVKLSGFLSADNTEGLVRILESNFPVLAERANNVTTLRKRR